MGDIQNLTGAEALDKIRELADGNMCMFCTFDDNGMHTRPMSTQEVEDDGSIWFFSQNDSEKNDEIAKDGTVHLIYSNEKSNEYLSVRGRCTIEYDRERIDKLWNMFLKTWFNDGKEDKNISLLRVRPEEGHYWDTKNNKVVSLAKIAIGAITGKTMDDSVEGGIKV